jgi:hypothetical protein
MSSALSALGASHVVGSVGSKKKPSPRVARVRAADVDLVGRTPDQNALAGRHGRWIPIGRDTDVSENEFPDFSPPLSGGFVVPAVVLFPLALVRRL